MKDTKYQIAERAKEEIDDIYYYSLLEFGTKQAQSYLAGLYDCFSMLVDFPNLGLNVDEVGADVQRHVHRRHAIYYEATQPLLILRVLGEEQDPHKQFSES